MRPSCLRRVEHVLLVSNSRIHSGVQYFHVASCNPSNENKNVVLQLLQLGNDTSNCMVPFHSSPCTLRLLVLLGLTLASHGP